MDSLDAAMHYLNKNMAVLPKGSNTLKKTGSLGAISHTPVAKAAQAAAEQQAKASIAKESDTSEAKEGGLMRYADGGGIGFDSNMLAKALAASTVAAQSNQTNAGIYQPQSMAAAQPTQQNAGIYQPQYQNYVTNPFNMANAPSYGGIPTPTNISMPNTIAPGSQGYPIDPKLMFGSPEYKAEKNRLAAEAAAAQAEQDRINASQSSYDAPAPGNKAGGLMMQDLHYAMGGGIGHLGGYSDGGHLLKGPGDGVSDSIPATIGGKQPARLAEGEFVIPARIVSELGNGSTDAGAKRLYAMMDRIKAKRSKTKNIAADTKAYKYLPA
jgi:hypothetical protein